MSLRHKLNDTSVKVVELTPYVATKLGKVSKAGGFSGPPPMPLDVFIATAVEALEGSMAEFRGHHPQLPTGRRARVPGSGTPWAMIDGEPWVWRVRNPAP
jgi:hypothetical protein